MLGSLMTFIQMQQGTRIGCIIIVQKTDKAIKKQKESSEDVSL
jgi:hypothetical protein